MRQPTGWKDVMPFEAGVAPVPRVVSYKDNETCNTKESGKGCVRCQPKTRELPRAGTTKHGMYRHPFCSPLGSQRVNCQLHMWSGLAWGTNRKEKKQHCVLGTSVPAVFQVWAAYRNVRSLSILSDCHLNLKGNAPLADHTDV